MNPLVDGRSPASREARMRQAQQALDAGQFTRALAMLDRLIQDDPAIVVLLRASEIAQMSGQYRRGRHYMLQAIAATVSGKKWRAMPFVARRALAFGERALVAELLDSMEWDHPQVLAAAPVLSQLLWLVGKFDSAIALADEAERRLGSNHLLSYSRANALRYIGRMQEATDEFERTIDMCPDYAFAHWSLAYHQASGTPGARVPRIEKAIARSNASDEEMAALHYALFKEFDAADRADQAWAALHEGMRFKRSQLATQASIGDQFVRNLLATRESPSGNEQSTAGNGPIFIVGMPRTGTTLLDRLLGAHPNAVSGGELPDLGHALAFAFDDPSGFPAPICARPPLRDESLAECYLERTRDLHAGTRRLIDKHPMNFWATNHVMSMPHSRVICMVREPMDACFSNLKEMFTGSAYAYSYSMDSVADHYAHFIKTAKIWQDRYPASFRLVRYENLVLNRDSVIAELQEFCGLEAMELDHVGNDAPMVSASNTEARLAIHTRSISAWQKYENWLGPLQERLDACGVLGQGDGVA